jgi:hypothetical protein
LTFSPKSPGFKPQTGQISRTKFFQAIRIQNQIFHGFNPKSTTETSDSDRNFARDFEGPQLRVLQKTYEIPLEVSFERKPDKFSKFRAKIIYCVRLFEIMLVLVLVKAPGA